MGDHSADTTTTTRADALRALAERVEAGESGAVIDECVLKAAGCKIAMDWNGMRYEYVDGTYVRGTRVTRSLDAVSAFTEAVLPGVVVSSSSEGFASIRMPVRDPAGGLPWRMIYAEAAGEPGDRTREPRARLAAALRAMAAEADQQ